MGSALMGSLQIWLLPLTYFIFPEVPGHTFFPNLSKLITFAAAPLVLTPCVSNQGMLQLGSDTAAGTNFITQAADYDLGAYNIISVYTKSSLFQQTTPAAITGFDSDQSVSSVAFPDLDLDSGQIGGTISWTAPASVSQVTHYKVYLAESTAGLNRAQVPGSVEVGTDEKGLDGNTNHASWTHVAVYSQSSLTEQSTPVAAAISDTSSPVQSVVFPDKDLDLMELGGSLTWSPPADVAHVVAYNAYLATSAAGADKSQLGGSLALGTNVVAIPANVATSASEDTWTHLVVYSKSSMDLLAEQTTPVALAISDSGASAQSPSFTDEDLDAGQLGGTVTWQAPTDTSHLAHYRAYLATSAAGADKSQIASAVAVGTNAVAVDENTAKGSYTHIVVYSKSTLAEQTTPASVAIEDLTGIMYLCVYIYIYI